jgi:uncharacterized SAM-binding protein YcdF (DUF218 family)
MDSKYKGVIVVLGSPNDAEGNLLSIALERCSQALAEFKQNPEYAVLPTGGWGAHFNTTDEAHAYYLKYELLGLGIPESAFLQGTESSNTIEDARLSRPILDVYPDAELIVVTSDFHADRARFLFTREFPDRRITVSESLTHLPPEDIARLRNHEKQALEKLTYKQ